MKAFAGTLVMVVVLGGVCGSCKQALGGPDEPLPTADPQTQAGPGATTAPAKVQWKLPPALDLRCWALDVSSDRKLATFWSFQKSGAHEESVWLVDLETGKVEDLLYKAGKQTAFDLVTPNAAVFSPDGRHIAVRAARNVGIIEPHTGKAALINGKRPRVGMAWAGNRLLLDNWDQSSHSYGPIEAYDLTGKQVEQLKLCGWLMGGDRDGKMLLVTTSKADPGKTFRREGHEEPVVAVVTPEGKILREVAPGGGICDRDTPLLSSHGRYVGAYCMDSPKGARWCRRIDRVDAQETIFLPTGWGGTTAISETGGCLSFECKSGNDATLCFWTRDGKRHVVAEKAMAGTIFGQEIFFVQGDSAAATLRAIPLPQSGPGVASQPAFYTHPD